MNQQVNLYQPIFRQQQKVFSAVTMAQIAVVVTIGLALLYGFARFQAGKIRVEVATLEQQRATAQAQFDRLTAELAARRDTSALTQQLVQAEQALAAKRRLLDWLAEQGSGNADTGGFADHVEGLARQHRAGLQLTTIGIGAGGRQVRLEGLTYEAADLMRYLRRLGAEPAFADVEFRTVRIDRDDEATAVGFVVSSEQLEPVEDAR